MVSYNDCSYIRELYQDFYIMGITRINNLAQRYEGGCEFPEVIITNYDPAKRQAEVKQISLFDFQEMEAETYCLAEGADKAGGAEE